MEAVAQDSRNLLKIYHISQSSVIYVFYWVTSHIPFSVFLPLLLLRFSASLESKVYIKGTGQREAGTEKVSCQCIIPSMNNKISFYDCKICSVNCSLASKAKERLPAMKQLLICLCLTSTSINYKSVPCALTCIDLIHLNKGLLQCGL